MEVFLTIMHYDSQDSCACLHYKIHLVQDGLVSKDTTHQDALIQETNRHLSHSCEIFNTRIVHQVHVLRRFKGIKDLLQLVDFFIWRRRLPVQSHLIDERSQIVDLPRHGILISLSDHIRFLGGWFGN